jgi:DNA-binding NarL/FixJ family response regulator
MNDQAQIRVFSVDDHPLLNEGIAALIGNQADMQLIAQATAAATLSSNFGNINPTSLSWTSDLAI